MPDIVCVCEREKGKEGERAHFLKLKKIAIIKIYQANPIRGLYYSDFWFHAHQLHNSKTLYLPLTRRTVIKGM